MQSTPLLEAAVVQWYWLQDTYPRCDQAPDCAVEGSVAQPAGLPLRLLLDGRPGRQHHRHLSAGRRAAGGVSGGRVHVMDRAALEDAAFEQRHSAGAVGALSRPSQPAGGALRWAWA